jgi:hypothetical protein
MKSDFWIGPLNIGILHLGVIIPDCSNLSLNYKSGVGLKKFSPGAKLMTRSSWIGSSPGKAFWLEKLPQRDKSIHYA